MAFEKSIKTDEVIDINRFISKIPDKYKSELIKEINEKINESIKKFAKKSINDISKISIPIEVFSNKNLGSLEALIKYLKENLGYKLKEISNLLNKNYSTVVNSYNNSKSKLSEIKLESECGIIIPLEIFKNSKFSTLETLIVYLKDNLSLKNSVIAKLINRSPKTIWSSYNRVQNKKINKKNE